MSLFRAREWWEVNLNENDAFDSHSLLTLNIGNDSCQSLLLGSHSGFLRLFSPSCKDLGGTSVSYYEPSHLLLEIRLSAPILQIHEGILVSGSNKKQLAILHPQLLSVYTMKKKETKNTRVGDQVIMELLYQHVLRHSSHSFVIGSFGGVHDRNFISVLSLDGLLSFYEQESFAFQVYLPNFLLPFGFSYLEKIDSFLFLNGFLTFECFTYESLAFAGTDKKLFKTWEFKLGECIVDVQTVWNGHLIVVVLSERSIYGLNENGSLIFAKRLGYTPVALCSYLTEEENKFMIVIAAKEQYLNLYEETRLKWSMKIPQTPVCVKRIFVNGLPGGLALLTEDGLLQCIYVGTHPSIYLAPPLAETQLNVVKAESELRELHFKVRESEPSRPYLRNRVNVSVTTDKASGKQKKNKSCDLFITINVPSALDSLQILVYVERPLLATNSNFFFSNFSGEALVESRIHLEGAGPPSSLTARVTVTHVASDGTGGCIAKKEILPLDLILAEAHGQKEAYHKLTLLTTHSAPNINHLFRDIISDDSKASAIAVKFLNSDQIVTLLSAKSTEKYRIQSDSLAAITLVLFTLVERLGKQSSIGKSNFEFTHVSPLPLASYDGALQFHNALVDKINSLEENLLKESLQYRIIQRKILNSYKSAAAKSPVGFHQLLGDTLNSIRTTLNRLEETDGEMLDSSCTLTSLNRLMIVLLQMADTQKRNFRLFQALFNPRVRDSHDQDWLEMQDATLSFFTKSTDEKEKDDAKSHTKSSRNTNKLIKCLGAAMERFAKDFRPSNHNQIRTCDEDEPFHPDHGEGHFRRNDFLEVLSLGIGAENSQETRWRSKRMNQQ